MAHLSPYHPTVFFRDLDTLHLDSLEKPSNEDRCYHLWALVFEYLGVLAFQHTQGEKRLTHAPQRSCRVSPRLLHHQLPPSTREFSLGVGLTSSPIGAPRTRFQPEEPAQVPSLDLVPNSSPASGSHRGTTPSDAHSSSYRTRLKRKAQEIQDPFEALSDSDSNTPDEGSLSSRETSFGSDVAAFSAELEDPATRRIPDSTIFVHCRGTNMPFYPVIVVENKPWPFSEAPFTASPAMAYQVHNAKQYRRDAAHRIFDTRKQAREQLQSVFHEYEGIQQVVYIYAIGAYFKVYEVTREMVANGQVPPLHPLTDAEIQYLFADPGQWDDGVGYERPSTNESINWRLNEGLIKCWKGVVGGSEG